MADIPWDREASLLRVTAFTTAEPAEDLVARGTVYELVGQAVELAPAQQAGLLIRAGLADGDVAEYDADAIRELAGHPGFTGAHGSNDTVDRVAGADGPERELADDEATLMGGGIAGPSPTDMRGQDGEK